MKAIMIPVYVGTKHTAAQAGDRWINVRCDKCGCEYAYELKRVARGYAHTHYGIGEESAPGKAEAAAREELQRQLADEAELVPCPQCHWIDEVAIEKFKRTEFGGCAMLLLILAVVGTLFCVWIGWMLSRGPGADRGAAGPVTFYGPLILWFIWVFTYAASRISRSRFDPNKNYPMEPVVPEGTPTAVMLDRHGNVVETVRKPQAMSTSLASSNHVIVELTNPRLPAVCHNCLGPSTVATIVKAGEFQVPIPSCSACQTPRLSARATVLLVAGYGILLLALSAHAVATSREMFDAVCYILLWGLLVFVVWLIHYAILISFRSNISLSRFDSRRGILTLWVRNPKYVEFVQKFRATNA